MRFASLGSGSSGNATLINSGGTTILLDCGFSCREMVQRLQLQGMEPEQIDAIVVTHEHNDHISGVGPFSRKYQIPVWMNQGTWLAKDIGRIDELCIFHSFRPFRIGEISLQPYIVPHDSREAVQFVFSNGKKRLAILTDLGHITPMVKQQMVNLDALVIEANHDWDMLWSGRYSPALKSRVSGDYGHLSNQQAAQLVAELPYRQMQHLVAAHLSQENNSVAKTRAAFAEIVADFSGCFHIACQNKGFDWKVIE